MGDLNTQNENDAESFDEILLSQTEKDKRVNWADSRIDILK